MAVEKAVKVTYKAEDTARGMTLGELADFVQTAMREDIPPETTVKITATWRQSIKKIEVHA